MNSDTEVLEVRGLAVLLIDMQPVHIAMLDFDTRKRLIATQVEMIRKCSRMNVPLFILENANSGETSSSLQQVISTVQQRLTIRKDFDDGFYGTGLGNALESLRIKKLLLMGVHASCCVKKNAQSAIKRKFEVITSETLIANGHRYAWVNKNTWYAQNCLLLRRAPRFRQS